MAIKNKLNDKWYRMDNSAIIYPMSITTTTQSLFRLGAEMKENVDEDALVAALNAILHRFPSFRVQLRSGVFKYFFDHNENKAVVMPDNGILFQKINFIENNHFLFRVSYYKNKFFVDYFHALCDGAAAIEFLKSLIYQYLTELGKNPPSDGSVLTTDDLSGLDEEAEDGFKKYHANYNLFGGVVSKMTGKNAYQIKGPMFKRVGYGLIQGYLDTEGLKAAAKKYDCTITALIVANAMLSTYESGKKRKKKENLIAMVPVNLRRHFPSKTMYNFTSFVRVSIDPETTEPTLKAYCEITNEQLKKELNMKDLSEKLSLSSLLSTKWFIKTIPLPIKAFFIKLGKKLSIKTKQTMIISNLGIVNMPKGTEEHLDRIVFNCNVSGKAPKNMGIVSYNNVTMVSFTRKVISTEIEKRFFKRLNDENIALEVVSNFRENEV